jgi:hypothetical protein
LWWRFAVNNKIQSTPIGARITHIRCAVRSLGHSAGINRAVTTENAPPARPPIKPSGEKCRVKAIHVTANTKNAMPIHCFQFRAFMAPHHSSKTWFSSSSIRVIVALK